MWMKNDCTKPACCRNPNGRCTPFTSAELTSKNAYPFGTFIFVGKPAISVIGDLDTYSCFALRTEYATLHDLSIKMGIHICFPSQNHNIIQFMIRYGDQTHRQKIEVSYDTTEFSELYRIDWLPDHVAFHIGKKLVHLVTLHDIMIPDNGMHIKVSLMPQQTNDGELHTFTSTVDDEVAKVLIINLIRFKKHDVPIEHVELHKAHSKHTFYIKEISCSAALLLTFTIVYFCNFKTSDIPDGYNSLQSEDIDSTKVWLAH